MSAVFVKSRGAAALFVATIVAIEPKAVAAALSAATP